MRLFSKKADTAEIFSVYLLFPQNYNTVLLIICQLQLVKNIEYKAQCHSDHTGQDHTCKLYISKLQGNSGKTYNKDNACQRQISGLAVIHVIVNQHTKAGGSDHSVKKERNSSYDRSRNGADQCCQFTKERTADGKHRR